jgi:hypothetical protein
MLTTKRRRRASVGRRSRLVLSDDLLKVALLARRDGACGRYRAQAATVAVASLKRKGSQHTEGNEKQMFQARDVR